MKGKNVTLLKLIIKVITLLTQYICTKKKKKIQNNINQNCKKLGPLKIYITSVPLTISRHFSITKLVDNSFWNRTSTLCLIFTSIAKFHGHL